MGTRGLLTLLAPPALLLASGPGCATAGRPCADGGDLAGLPETKGDMECFQKDIPGRPVNHGRFRLFYPDGTTAVEGQFTSGVRTGAWSFFDEKGKKTAERLYDRDGIEIGRGAPGS